MHDRCAICQITFRNSPSILKLPPTSVSITDHIHYITGPDTKGKNKAKPEKDEDESGEEEEEDEEEAENGSGDAPKDTKNGAAADKKPTGPMALGEIAFIDSKITSTKIDGLQPLYNVSG